MPLRFVIDEAAEIVLTTATGDVTAADLLEHAEALVRVLNRPSRELVDFSEPRDLTVTMDAVREMAEYLRAEDANAGGSRLALVGGSDAIFGTLRLFATRREHENLAIGVFRDRDEALRWLTREEPPPGVG